MILIRSLHEADRILGVFCDPAESGLLARWLADERTIKPSEFRKAEQRFEERLGEWMTDEGLPELPRTEQPTRDLYSKYSEAAHHRRAYVKDLVSSPLRQMLRGPATAWERRAVAVGVAVAAVEEAVESVGGGLAFFYGTPWQEHAMSHARTPSMRVLRLVGERKFVSARTRSLVLDAVFNRSPTCFAPPECRQ